MEKLARLTTEDRDNLTAYLDGELDETTTRRIESVLAGSSVARNDVELLARTYELLDDLPKPKAPADFTERTVATAKLEGIRQPISQQRWYRITQRALVLAAWTLMMIASSAAGFALATHWVSQPQDMLIDELPMIRHLDVYSEVGNVEFLHQLRKERELLDDIRARTGRDSK